MFTQSLSDVGRSPLTRGRRAWRQERRPGAGSIPAHAGQTGQGGGLRHHPEVDPRSRGADKDALGHDRGLSGRSPLTRGRHIRPAVLAMAGVVDPRSRGADRGAGGSGAGGQGRSPLTRGRLMRRSLKVERWWSIPAHAGQTGGGTDARHPAQVDPRSRGADEQDALGSRDQQGRSPLTRGRQMSFVQIVLALGSIPAHAGQTAVALHRRGRQEVDPRSRGADSWCVLLPS